jgi:hypothetical protein
MSSKSHMKNIEVADVTELFARMKEDAIENGVNMFNCNDSLVNNRNMIIYFYQFVKKYIVDTQTKDGEIVSV